MVTPGSLRQIAGNRPIVAFDFDGTLTTMDSFTAFLAWKAEPLGYFAGLVTLAPHIAAYAGNRDRGRLKAAATARFLGGMTMAAVTEAAERFAVARAPSILRPDAVRTWRGWRAQNAVVGIVTASPDLVVKPFARGLGADFLIGTQLAVDAEGRVTGQLSTPNCRGAEKVRRLREAFGDDLALTAAYGDTAGDREMIAIAQVKGYRVFRGRP
jgi:phosphatidylglycerophosphatase C